MERLEECWRNKDGDLPFDTSARVSDVYQCLLNIQRVMPIDQQLCARVRQWVRFHRAMSRDDGSPPESYDRILLLVRDTEVTERVTSAPGHWRHAR